MEMKTASMISTGLHVVVLAWAAFSLSGHSYIVPPAESLPVDFVSEKQFSELTKGVKDAPKPVEKPKPVVEKKADVSKPVEDLKPKVTEKKEVKPEAEKAPEPPKPPEPKPEKKKAAEKPAEKPPETKPDPIAKKIEQQAEKKEAKADPAPLPRRKPPIRKPEHKEPKFNADKIAALLDKRTPERTAATGDAINPNAGLGRVNGQAARLSQSELDALRRRISTCWTPPVGADSAQDLTVVFRVIFNPDGTVKRGPDVVEGGASAYGPIFAESAKRAILQCQPYTMLRRETYNVWKDMEIGFRPSDMFR
jgi:colicin import membrane protein